MKARQELLQGDTQPARQDIQQDIQQGAMSCQEQNPLTSSPLCQNLRDLLQCPTFQGMALRQRRKTLKRLQSSSCCISVSHTYAECQKKSICTVKGCNEPHSMRLHNHMQEVSTRHNLAHSKTEQYRFGYQNSDYENWCQPDYSYARRETSLTEWRSRVQEECSPY